MLELKTQYPVCGQHRMHCWTGHPSEVHVQLTEMRFRAWATDLASAFLLSITDDLSDIIF